MILNLLRVETIRVEDMMKNSFREVSEQLQIPQITKLLKSKKAQLNSLESSGEHFSELIDYYEVAKSFLDIHKNIMVNKLKFFLFFKLNIYCM